MRSDRQGYDDSQSDRQRRNYRNDYRHEAGPQYFVQGQSFGSTTSMRKPGNMHGVYTPQSAASNGGSALSGPPGPPYYMVSSYEQGANYGASSSEPIEFGSLGPLPAADGDDIPQSTRQVIPNGFHGQRRGGSSHSSPDRPSSPQPRRFASTIHTFAGSVFLEDVSLEVELAFIRMLTLTVYAIIGIAVFEMLMNCLFMVNIARALFD
ncbi:hypothetical protein HU200_025430 [Digitaria exilis]|uniref:Uncharacterized protein n=1 Tax=Digitaria exilis TaxID=1010633 RepID=A0A835BXG6_9POAL|nr:hypothetical protein HU200_025430 [Digitaria exilis]